MICDLKVMIYYRNLEEKHTLYKNENFNNLEYLFDGKQRVITLFQ